MTRREVVPLDALPAGRIKKALELRRLMGRSTEKVQRLPRAGCRVWLTAFRDLHRAGIMHVEMSPTTVFLWRRPSGRRR